MTAMALQALAKYRDRQDVEDAVQRGLAALSALQEPNGAYLSWDEENSESVCQVIVALTELGISLDDERFVKNGRRCRRCWNASPARTEATATV